MRARNRSQLLALPAGSALFAALALSSCGPQKTLASGANLKSNEGIKAAIANTQPPGPTGGHATAREKSVFAAINTDFPGLEKVRSALDAGDYAGATRELAAYYRTRKSPRWRTNSDRDPEVRYHKRIADNSSQGIIIGPMVKVEHAFPDGDIDWFFNATKDHPDKDVAFNPEWQWQNNRMQFWPVMGNAYKATGDEKYAKAFVAQMNDWIADCPVPAENQNTYPSAWRTIEAGIRMGNAWPDSFHIFLHSPSFGDADLVNFLGAIADHAGYLKKYPSAANWLTMEMSGLYTCGAIFPEFKDARAWRDFAAETMSVEMDRQFLPDGGHVELSGGYHMVAVKNFLAIIEAARCGGFEHELPSNYLAGLEKAYDYILALRTPDCNIPCFNDSWPVHSSYIYEQAAAFFPGRSDFKWALTDGREGSMPAFQSRFLDWSGFAVMRSGWDKADNYLVFDVGPLGYGHVHQDKLNVVLWAHGREMLFDGGGASYEASKWRAWSLSTASHNSVLVDGFSQNVPFEDDKSKRYQDPAHVAQTPIDAGWISNDNFDYATGTFDGGQGPDRLKIATHNRQVLFVKPDIYLVVDTLQPNDTAEHTYQARWHLLTTQTEHNPVTGEVATTDVGLANLVVLPLLTAGLEVVTASEQETPEILGWEVRKDRYPMCKPATTVLHTVHGVGEKQLATLLLPLKPGETSPVAKVEGGAISTVTLKDGRLFLISTAGDLELEERLADGRPGRVARSKQ